jgi:hypothetical protein
MAAIWINGTEIIRRKRMASLGEKRVRVTFNPSAVSAVDNFKQVCAGLIDKCKEVEDDAAGDPEVIRLCRLAMTDFENGAMWIVKALTAGK